MRSLQFATLASVALLLPGCGSNPPTGVPIPSPTPAPVTTNIFSRPFEGLVYPYQSCLFGLPGTGQACIAFFFQDVSVSNSGQVEVRFDYTFDTSDIRMIVTQDSCQDPFAAYNGVCPALGSDKAGPKASKRADVVFQLPAATTIRVWVYNFTHNQESGVLSVLLTH